MKEYVDSPFLWSGKKTKLLPQIEPLFPKTKIFVDVFGGSGSVSVNSCSEIVLCVEKTKKSSNFELSDLFFYFDPPYSITRINGYKSDYNDTELFDLLKCLTNKGIKWGMSNVFSHKGSSNDELREFSGYNTVNHLNFDYSNLNNTMLAEKSKAETNLTDEVYIYNY